MPPPPALRYGAPQIDMKIGIMGAMQEEVAGLLRYLEEPVRTTCGMRDYHTGRLSGHDAVVVFSRWGKVAAASTATTLIERHGVDFIVFTGVAGAIDPALNVGDIVIADALVQHDLDASAVPGIRRFEVPLLGVRTFPVDTRVVDRALASAWHFIREDMAQAVPAETLAAFGIASPRACAGLIASGDQFIASPAKAAALARELPGLRCVEMEGAAVAQVAHEHGIPCVVLRTISDKADHTAGVDFPRFLTGIASPFTCGVVLRFLREWA